MNIAKERAWNEIEFGEKESLVRETKSRKIEEER